MRISIFSSLVLTALLAVTGCSTGTEGSRLSTTPVNHVGVSVAESVEASDPSSWTPPEEMSFALSDTSETRATSRSRNVASALPTPNQHEAVRGQVHAAY